MDVRPLPVGGAKPNSDYGYGLLNAGAATAPLPEASSTKRSAR